MSAESSIGCELTDLILEITNLLAPKWGVEKASCLAHVLILTMQPEIGLPLFDRLHKMGLAEVISFHASTAEDVCDRCDCASTAWHWGKGEMRQCACVSLWRLL